MSKAIKILALLADGSFHSGDELGVEVGLSRSGVWKLINKITDEYGVDCHKVKGRGYSIPGGIQFLKAQSIKEMLSTPSLSHLSNIEILFSIDSTNTYLLSQLSTGLPSGYACFSEHQSAGRGRRGRKWFSPFGCNIFLSLAWRFTQGAVALEGLTLCVAVAVARALAAYGVEGVQVKWPNDIFFQGKKLAGILVELQGVAHVETCVVVGVGLNVAMPLTASTYIERDFIDVATIVGHRPDRNRLAGLLLDALLDLLGDFKKKTFLFFKSEWSRLDMLKGTSIELLVGDECIAGIAQGVDERGALLVNVDGVVRSFNSGEVIFNHRTQ